MTKILKCSCEHKAQDKVHGKKMRVMNSTEKAQANSSFIIYRCTVCKAEHYA